MAIEYQNGIAGFTKSITVGGVAYRVFIPANVPVDEDGVPSGGGGGGTAGTTSTAAAPSYGEGATEQALSTNLTGDLRTTTKIADGADVATGATADTAYTDTTGAAVGSVLKVLKGLFVRAALGSTAALQGALTETAPASDTASSGLNGRLQRIAQRITSLITALGTPLQAGGTVVVTGVATETTLTAQSTLMGAVTETAPASDTASSGNNGRLQRIAQRLTSLITALGTPLQAGGNIGNISGTITLPTGAASETTSLDVAASLAAIETAAGTALTRTADSVAATDTINYIMDGLTPLAIKFAAISASSSGDNTLVAAVASKKIRVLAYNIMGAGAVNARFQTAAAGAYLTGYKYIAAAGGGISASYNPKGWFETVAGDLLNLELSGAVAVGGELVYIEV